jgi:hypothetical protein
MVGKIYILKLHYLKISKKNQKIVRVVRILVAAPRLDLNLRFSR